METEELQPNIVSALSDAREVLNGPNITEEDITAFNQRHTPIIFLGRGGESIVLKATENQVVSIFREEPDDRELHHLRQAECIIDILHTIAPQHFPKVELFVEQIYRGVENDRIVGTIRQFIPEVKPEGDIAALRKDIDILLTTLNQLGLPIVIDAVTNLVMNAQTKQLMYIDLPESIHNLGPQVAQNITAYMQHSENYTEDQIIHVLSVLAKLQQLKREATL